MRPINALVDITNYIAYDRGRPLHVYDADKLTGAIRARLGRKGEKFLALDGKTYEVDEDCCVIADDRAVLGLGGVIGGEDTGVTDSHHQCLHRVGLFRPEAHGAHGAQARHSVGRAVQIRARRRSRFRGAGARACHGPGAARYAAAKPSKITVAGKPPKPNRPFKFDLGLVKRLSGLDLGPGEIKRLLAALGVALDGKGKHVKAAPPSWRPDITGPADLVEEVVRLTGVDAVPATPMTRAAGVAAPVLTEAQRRQRLTRRVLAARGFVEAVTWSFVPPEQAKLFGGGQAELTLSNPISTELAQMRPSLLPGLITAAQRNRDRGFADGALFELGQAYRGAQPEDQFVAASGVRFGHSALSGSGRHWSGEAPAAEVFAAKADAVAALAALGLDQASLTVTREAPSWFHPGRSGALKLGPKTVLGTFGEFHPDLLAKLGIDAPIAGFELYLDAVPPSKRKGAGKALEASDLQPVRRDFAFLLDR